MAGRWLRRVANARLTKALGVALAVQVVLTSFTGLATAPTTSSDAMPARFSVPGVQEGDVAVYEVQPAEGRAPQILGRTLERVAIEWRGNGWTYSPNGTAEPVTRLSLYFDLRNTGERTGSEQPHFQTETPDVEIRPAYDPTTWRAETTTFLKLVEKRARSLEPLGEGAADQKYKRSFRSDLTNPPTPCGFHLPAHGPPVNLSRPLGQAGDCGGSGDRLVPRSIVSVNGTRAVSFQSTGENPVSVAYAPGLPIPISWEGPLSRLGAKQTPRIHLELSGYSPGGGPSPGAPETARPEPVAVPVSDAKPWGPAERNTDKISYPLSTAYADLLNESEDARAFLDEHPEAYTARAWMFKGRDQANQPRTNWQIVLTNGTDTLERIVSRGNPIEAPVNGAKLAPPPRVQTRDQRWVPDHLPEPLDRYPDPDEIPSRLPVVGTTGLWDEGNGDYAPWEEGRPAHYGMGVVCRSTSCEPSRSIVEVGSRGPERGPQLSYTLPWAQNVSSVAYGFDAMGDLVYVTGHLRNWTGASIQTEGSQATPPSASPGFEAGTWSFPSAEAAAGATLLALLSGAIYYFWPKLKLVGLALYSRIGNDPEEVLDNDRRKRIRDIVGEEPGIHFNELRRRLDTGRGVLEHHLDRLKAAGLIVEEDSGPYTCYFQAGTVDRQVRQTAAQLRADTAREIASSLSTGSADSVTELADAVGISRSTASYHLDRLSDAGLVELEADGNARTIHLTDLGRRASDRLNLG